MFGLGADEPEGAETGEVGDGFLDVLRGLQLRIKFAAVADAGHELQVGGVVDGVVDMQPGPFDRGQLGSFRIIDGFGESGAGFDGGPGGGMVQAEVPGAGPTHRKAAKDDAVGVDLVLGPHGGDGFKDVGFAGPAVGVVAAAVDFQFDAVGDDVRLGGEEAFRGDLGVAAVQDDVEAHWLRFVKLLRHVDAVGLRGAVDAGDVGFGREGRRGGGPQQKNSSAAHGPNLRP